MIVIPSSSSSCSSAFLLDTSDVSLRSSSSSSLCSKRFNSVINCSGSSLSGQNYNNNEKKNIPKLEPFSRSKLERGVKDPPLIQKCETQLSDYCSTLEGEKSYNCWQAYFELKDLEEESPKEEVEKLIIEAGGVKSLIGCLHGVAAIHKAKKETSEKTGKLETIKRENEEEKKIEKHKPDGLPKSAEEIEEEEKAKMPDSPYTRLLRLRGKYPAWYTPVPDHETC